MMSSSDAASSSEGKVKSAVMRLSYTQIIGVIKEYRKVPDKQELQAADYPSGSISAAATQESHVPFTKDKALTRARYQELLKKKHVKCWEEAYQECVRREKLAAKKTVTLKMPYSTNFGQEVFITGSIGVLGEWNPSRALKMDWTQGNIWTATFDIPADVNSFEFKCVVRQEGCSPIWEPGMNHFLQLTSAKIIVDAFWGEGGKS